MNPQCLHDLVTLRGSVWLLPYTATALTIMLALTKQPASQQITKSTQFYTDVICNDQSLVGLEPATL